MTRHSLKTFFHPSFSPTFPFLYFLSLSSLFIPFSGVFLPRHSLSSSPILLPSSPPLSFPFLPFPSLLFPSLPLLSFYLLSFPFLLFPFLSFRSFSFPSFPFLSFHCFLSSPFIPFPSFLPCLPITLRFVVQYKVSC